MAGEDAIRGIAEDLKGVIYLEVTDQTSISGKAAIIRIYPKDGDEPRWNGQVASDERVTQGERVMVFNGESFRLMK